MDQGSLYVQFSTFQESLFAVQNGLRPKISIERTDAVSVAPLFLLNLFRFFVELLQWIPLITVFNDLYLCRDSQLGCAIHYVSTPFLSLSEINDISNLVVLLIISITICVSIVVFTVSAANFRKKDVNVSRFQVLNYIYHIFGMIFFTDVMRLGVSQFSCHLQLEDRGILEKCPESPIFFINIVLGCFLLLGLLPLTFFLTVTSPLIDLRRTRGKIVSARVDMAAHIIKISAVICGAVVHGLEHKINIDNLEATSFNFSARLGLSIFLFFMFLCLSIFQYLACPHYRSSENRCRLAIYTACTGMCIIAVVRAGLGINDENDVESRMSSYWYGIIGVLGAAIGFSSGMHRANAFACLFQRDVNCMSSSFDPHYASDLILILQEEHEPTGPFLINPADVMQQQVQSAVNAAANYSNYASAYGQNLVNNLNLPGIAPLTSSIAHNINNVLITNDKPLPNFINDHNDNIMQQTPPRAAHVSSMAAISSNHSTPLVLPPTSDSEGEEMQNGVVENNKMALNGSFNESYNRFANMLTNSATAKMFHFNSDINDVNSPKKMNYDNTHNDQYEGPIHGFNAKATPFSNVTLNSNRIGNTASHLLSSTRTSPNIQNYNSNAIVPYDNRNNISSRIVYDPNSQNMNTNYNILEMNNTMNNEDSHLMASRARLQSYMSSQNFSDIFRALVFECDFELLLRGMADEWPTLAPAQREIARACVLQVMAAITVKCCGSLNSSGTHFAWFAAASLLLFADLSTATSAIKTAVDCRPHAETMFICYLLQKACEEARNSILTNGNKQSKRQSGVSDLASFRRWLTNARMLHERSLIALRRFFKTIIAGGAGRISGIEAATGSGKVINSADVQFTRECRVQLSEALILLRGAFSAYESLLSRYPQAPEAQQLNICINRQFYRSENEGKEASTIDDGTNSMASSLGSGLAESPKQQKLAHVSDVVKRTFRVVRFVSLLVLVIVVGLTAFLTVMNVSELDKVDVWLEGFDTARQVFDVIPDSCSSLNRIILGFRDHYEEFTEKLLLTIATPIAEITTRGSTAVSPTDDETSCVDYLNAEMYAFGCIVHYKDGSYSGFIADDTTGVPQEIDSYLPLLSANYQFDVSSLVQSIFSQLSSRVSSGAYSSTMTAAGEGGFVISDNGYKGFKYSTWGIFFSPPGSSGSIAASPPLQGALTILGYTDEGNLKADDLADDLPIYSSQLLTYSNTLQQVATDLGMDKIITALTGPLYTVDIYDDNSTNSVSSNLAFQETISILSSAFQTIYDTLRVKYDFNDVNDSAEFKTTMNFCSSQNVEESAAILVIFTDHLLGFVDNSLTIVTVCAVSACVAAIIGGFVTIRLVRSSLSEFDRSDGVTPALAIIATLPRQELRKFGRNISSLRVDRGILDPDDEQAAQMDLRLSRKAQRAILLEAANSQILEAAERDLNVKHVGHHHDEDDGNDDGHNFLYLKDVQEKSYETKHLPATDDNNHLDNDIDYDEENIGIRGGDDYGGDIKTSFYQSRNIRNKKHKTKNNISSNQMNRFSSQRYSDGKYNSYEDINDGETGQSESDSVDIAENAISKKNSVHKVKKQIHGNRKERSMESDIYSLSNSHKDMKASHVEEESSSDTEVKDSFRTKKTDFLNNQLSAKNGARLHINIVDNVKAIRGKDSYDKSYLSKSSASPSIDPALFDDADFNSKFHTNKNDSFNHKIKNNASKYSSVGYNNSLNPSSKTPRFADELEAIGPVNGKHYSNNPGTHFNNTNFSDLSAHNEESKYHKDKEYDVSGLKEKKRSATVGGATLIGISPDTTDTLTNSSSKRSSVGAVTHAFTVAFSIFRRPVSRIFIVAWSAVFAFMLLDLFFSRAAVSGYKTYYQDISTTIQVVFDMASATLHASNVMMDRDDFSFRKLTYDDYKISFSSNAISSYTAFVDLMDRVEGNGKTTVGRRTPFRESILFSDYCFNAPCDSTREGAYQDQDLLFHGLMRGMVTFSRRSSEFLTKYGNGEDRVISAADPDLFFLHDAYVTDFKFGFPLLRNSFEQEALDKVDFDQTNQFVFLGCGLALVALIIPIVVESSLRMQSTKFADALLLLRIVPARLLDDYRVIERVLGVQEEDHDIPAGSQPFGLHTLDKVSKEDLPLPSIMGQIPNNNNNKFVHNDHSMSSSNILNVNGTNLGNNNFVNSGMSSTGISNSYTAGTSLNSPLHAATMESMFAAFAAASNGQNINSTSHS